MKATRALTSMMSLSNAFRLLEQRVLRSRARVKAGEAARGPGLDREF